MWLARLQTCNFTPVRENSRFLSVNCNAALKRLSLIMFSVNYITSLLNPAPGQLHVCRVCILSGTNGKRAYTHTYTRTHLITPNLICLAGRGRHTHHLSQAATQCIYWPCQMWNHLDSTAWRNSLVILRYIIKKKELQLTICLLIILLGFLSEHTVRDETVA